MKISPQVAFEGSMQAFDAHIAAKQVDIESYARKPGAKQGYIDRQWETVNHYYGFKSSVLEYIAELKDEIHLLKVANANANFCAKVQEQEITELIKSDFFDAVNEKTNGK